MDPLDFAVYRFLSPGGVARFWAGRRVIDPRITPREIAEKVGISESGARTRLHHLAGGGFLRDQTVTPNPALFGKQVFVADLLVRQSGEVDRILRDLTLVEGVVFTRDVMDEDERTIQVYFVADDAGAAVRLSALLGRLAAADAHGPAKPACRPYYIPPCERELSPLDWRVLQAVWRHPEATFAEIARAVGISLKTAARSYHQLITSRACWWTHGQESEEFPLALVCVNLRGPSDSEPIAGWIGQEGQAWMPVASDGFGLDPADASSVLAVLLPADLPTVLERFLRKLATLEGVEQIHRTFALGSATYVEWFADRIASHARSRARPA